MKKLVSLFIALLLFVSVFSMSAMAAEDCVYLSDIEMQSYTKRNDNWIPGIDQVAYHKKTITIAGNSYDKGISMHPIDAGSGKESECVWDISTYDYNCFKAVIGKDDAGKTGADLEKWLSSKASFYVYVDDVLAFEQVVLANVAQEIEVTIPAGAKKITLKLGDGGDSIYCDVSDFAEARLCNVETNQEEQEVLKDVVYVSDIEMKSYTKRNDNWIPGVDIVAYHKSKINVNGTYYDKGITMHPIDAGSGKESECVWDISGYSQKYFYAVIGKDMAGLNGLTAQQSEQWKTTKASFYVYFDDVLAYEKVVAANSAEVVKLEIPEGTTLLTFKLGDGGDGIFCDISAFADAKIYNVEATTPDTPDTPDNPETGDSSMLFVGCAIAAVMSICAVFYLKKENA